MNKKLIIVICVCLVLGIVLCTVIFFVRKGDAQEAGLLPHASKAPADYSWEEYQSMGNEDKDAFFHRFESVEDFETWKEAADPEENTSTAFQWDEPGKQPNEYSWEEYQTLTAEKQEAFYQWFESLDEFERWMEKEKPSESTAPIQVWTKPGKQPNEYTWEEYQLLGLEDRDAFFLWFDSQASFEDWMDEARPAETTPVNPIWEGSEKEPNQYTWIEYQALSPEDQEAFFQWFGSLEAFEEWMDAVQPAENQSEVAGWDRPGKLPDAYTWEEYDALTPEEQDAFFLWFETMEDFEAWLNQAKKD